MLSIRPSPLIITLSIARTSLSIIIINLSIIIPAPPPRTLVGAIIKIYISNLSRTATINLTNANTTSTSLILESQLILVLLTLIANFSNPRPTPYFRSLECNITKVMP